MPGTQGLVHREHNFTQTLSQARQVLARCRVCLASKNSEGTLECMWDAWPGPENTFLVNTGPIIGDEICHSVVHPINTSDPTSSATSRH